MYTDLESTKRKRREKERVQWVVVVGVKERALFVYTVVDDSVQCFKLICRLLIQCWMFLLFVIWKSSSFDNASIY